MRVGNGTVVSIAFICLVCVFIAHHILPGLMYTTGGCIMTFMWPSYLPLPIYDHQRQYTLERYVEGSSKQQLYSPGDNSIPVLFLPGSSGSKAQARSIASEAYRYAARHSPHSNHSTFAVYTVGTNEELSAMDARLINSQAQFFSRCLQYLHTLHTAPVAIVIGHSMGGVVARAASAQQNIAQSLLLITVSSPYSPPPTMTLPSGARLNQLLRMSENTRDPLVSISAGSYDFQVPTAAAEINSKVQAKVFQVNMATMEGVWVSAEHQCAIWCNQLASKIGSMIVEESQQLLHALKWPVLSSARETHHSASALPDDGHNAGKLNGVSLEHETVASSAVLNAHQRLGRMWKASKRTSTEPVGNTGEFWEGIDPILLLPDTDKPGTIAWRFAEGEHVQHGKQEALEVTFMFSGKPDTLSVDVLLTDGSGEDTMVDVSAVMTGLPLPQRRTHHNPKIAPADVYSGLQYDWHGLYFMSLNPSSFPGKLVQGIRMSARCSKAHTLHDALVYSDLVSQPLQNQAHRYCSTVSVQTVLNNRVQLSMGALVRGTTVSARQSHSQNSCPSGASSCDNLCSAAVTLTLAPSVTLWNQLLPFLQFSPVAVSAAGCTQVPIYPRNTWAMQYDGEYAELQAVHPDQWIMILPQCTEAEVYLQTAVATNVYHALYMSAPFVLLCMVATLMLQLTRRGRLLLLNEGSDAPNHPFLWHWVLFLSGVVLLSWPQSSVVAKGLAACTGVAAGHLLDVCVHGCLRVSVVMLSKFPRKVNSHRSQAPSKWQGLLLGVPMSTKNTLLFITIMLLTFLHIFVGLFLATALLAYSVAAQFARSVLYQPATSHVRDVNEVEQEQQELESSGPASYGSLKLRHQGTPATMVANRAREHVQHATSDWVGAVHDEYMTLSSCLQSHGHTVISLLLMSTVLALPSAVAAAKSSWMPQAVEDILPAVAMVIWACLSSAACHSESGKKSDCVSISSRAGVPQACRDQTQGTLQCRFSQLVLSQAQFETKFALIALLSMLTWAAGCSSAFVACGMWSAYRVGCYSYLQASRLETQRKPAHERKSTAKGGGFD